jgi:S1-C subfamily serine protease
MTLADVLAGLDPGQTVTVAVVRSDGAKQTLRVTLGSSRAETTWKENR